MALVYVRLNRPKYLQTAAGVPGADDLEELLSQYLATKQVRPLWLMRQLLLAAGRANIC